MDDFNTQVQCDDYNPSAQDWAEWCDYLDSIGYDGDGDDWEEDPDSNYGFQNLDTDCPFQEFDYVR